MTVRMPSGMRLVNLLLGSWTGLIFAFLYLPIVLLVIYSFNQDRYNNNWTGFTFKWYGQLGLEWYPESIGHLWHATLGKLGLGAVPPVLRPAPPLVKGLNNSLIVAAFTTVLSVVLGTIGGWLLYRYRYPMARLIGTLVLIPMIVPEIIMGISLLLLFVAMVGFGNNLLAWSGVNGWLAGTWLGSFDFGLGLITIVIAHVTFCFPFVLVAIQARLAGVDPALEEAAMDLGATPTQAFLKVMVPYLLPAIISGALMSFTLSMDELIVTVFVKGAGSETLPIEIFGRVRRPSPALNAISTIFILATGLVVVVAEYLRRFRGAETGK